MLLEKVKVLEIMTKLCIVSEYYDIKDAARLMLMANIVRLPVISEANKLIGMVTLRFKNKGGGKDDRNKISIKRNKNFLSSSRG